MFPCLPLPFFLYFQYLLSCQTLDSGSGYFHRWSFYASAKPTLIRLTMDFLCRMQETSAIYMLYLFCILSPMNNLFYSTSSLILSFSPIVTMYTCGTKYESISNCWYFLVSRVSNTEQQLPGSVGFGILEDKKGRIVLEDGWSPFLSWVSYHSLCSLPGSTSWKAGNTYFQAVLSVEVCTHP